jgi:hypothetical protein
VKGFGRPNWTLCADGLARPVSEVIGSDDTALALEIAGVALDLAEQHGADQRKIADLRRLAREVREPGGAAGRSTKQPGEPR